MIQELINSSNPYLIWINVDKQTKNRIASILSVPVNDVLRILPLVRYASQIKFPEPVNELEYE
jgi:hypothetical protein